MPATLTPEPTKREARKRRANERHVVGCCEELGGAPPPTLLPCQADHRDYRPPERRRTRDGHSIGYPETAELEDRLNGAAWSKHDARLGPEKQQCCDNYCGRDGS